MHFWCSAVLCLAVSVGYAAAAITAFTQSEEANVVVTVALAVSGVTDVPLTLTLAEDFGTGTITTISATGSANTVTWTSSNASAIAITNAGVVTATLDYEASDSMTVTLTYLEDASALGTVVLTLAVTDVNDTGADGAAADQICNVPADIVFVVDGSDSIYDEDFVLMKNFVANLIDNFAIGPDAIHVGMIVYSTDIGNAYFAPTGKNWLKTKAMNLEQPKFGTDTALGIEEARKMIAQQGRPHAPDIIVVITDGRSANPSNTIIQASIAKENAITMIAIGVGQHIFSEELSQIATPGLVSEVADFQSLEHTVNTVRNLICTSITTAAPTTTMPTTTAAPTTTMPTTTAAPTTTMPTTTP